ncbi:hypothetical protein L596_013653 [Steinernema carpocapsae]|uniref:TIL domain-containing protein n=1 Tax=Steinernema carpocapsae TaxID=34508 RepID=A0A4U5P1P3_STECR|nr:hypothetical protein L596_013653 [Steinernema carpocapsae]
MNSVWIVVVALIGFEANVNGQTTSSSRSTTRILDLSTSTARPVSATNLTCGQNEIVTNCLPCEDDCETTVRNITTICIGSICFDDGPQFCECPMNGFARNNNGNCVPDAQCPTPTCPSGEQWSENPCDGTCEVLQPNCTLFNCLLPDCACKPGYVRFFDYCIPKEMCPQKKVSRCRTCEAGKICKRHHGWFDWFFEDVGSRYSCEWYTPCEIGLGDSDRNDNWW